MATAAIGQKATRKRSNVEALSKVAISRQKQPHATASVGQVALVLQGGGALGAYQVGVLRALDEAGYQPEWFAGTSIGAINAAIMAGSAPEHRLSRLHEFWNKISRTTFCGTLANVCPGRVFRAWSAWQTVVLGQPGFFQWRAISPWLAPPGTPAARSYYVADELKQTLSEIVDLDRINAGSVRLSLGVVKVATGEQVYFDSRTQRIGYDHIMASAALPPSFPPIEIDGDWYWDGGIVSNTPLDVIIDQMPRSTLCFMVDLFDAAGNVPRTIEGVEARHKDIVYASRSGRSIEAHRTKHDLILKQYRETDPSLRRLLSSFRACSWEPRARPPAFARRGTGVACIACSSTRISSTVPQGDTGASPLSTYPGQLDPGMLCPLSEVDQAISMTDLGAELSFIFR